MEVQAENKLKKQNYQEAPTNTILIEAQSLKKNDYLNLERRYIVHFGGPKLQPWELFWL